MKSGTVCKGACDFICNERGEGGGGEVWRERNIMIKRQSSPCPVPRQSENLEERWWCYVWGERKEL